MKWISVNVQSKNSKMRKRVIEMINFLEEPFPKTQLRSSSRSTWWHQGADYSKHRWPRHMVAGCPKSHLKITKGGVNDGRRQCQRVNTDSNCQFTVGEVHHLSGTVWWFRRRRNIFFRNVDCWQLSWIRVFPAMFSGRELISLLTCAIKCGGVLG